MYISLLFNLFIANLHKYITHKRKYFSISHARGPIHWLGAHNHQQGAQK